MLELAVLSAAFAMGAAIPDRYACGPCSPPLSWSEPPAGTQSLARGFERVVSGRMRDLAVTR